MLVGLKEKDITEKIRSWYFQQAEQVFDIDVANDIDALNNLSTKILDDLLKVRKEVFSKRTP